MFDIEYKGGNTVVITTKKAALVIDPKLSIVGLKDVEVKNSVEVATEARFANEGTGAMLKIEGPGEYEVGDFSIRGVGAVRHIDGGTSKKQSTMYRVEIGDVRMGVLGNIDEKLSEDQLESLGVVDILVIPVGGGGYTLDATSAAGLVRRIDPKLVIPVHYADTALTYEVPQSELSVFTGELGAPIETTQKYKVKSAASVPTILTVLELTRS